MFEYLRHLEFDDVVLCKHFLIFEGSWCLLLLWSLILVACLYLQIGGTTALWTVQNHLLNTVSYPRRREYSTTSSCVCRGKFSYLGNVHSARCKAPSSLAACFRSSGWPSSLYALFSASHIGHCTWRNDGTAWEQHFVSLLPWHQFQVKVLGIILIERTLYIICNWSPGGSITRM